MIPEGELYFELLFLFSSKLFPDKNAETKSPIPVPPNCGLGTFPFRPSLAGELNPLNFDLSNNGSFIQKVSTSEEANGNLMQLQANATACG
ncbi:hypothetical protein CEXT_194961 [Caerostris extrusa]|uniref:Uncharacterized protein n=1 Tax=Caerostris extrusa TaxID=172846 RepID=A0AAV4M6J4_CAEEX|nr:hypothetical protein CEXT_194961 [Caerostris extrusa]